MELNLESLLVPSKEVEVDYPGLDGFKVNVAFLSREELVKIRKKAVTTKYKNRQPVEELNEELFLKLYVQNVIKGWSGLKLSFLEKLMLVDMSKVSNKDDELNYSESNALTLMKNSTEFDAFITDMLSDLQNFTSSNLNK